MMRLRLVILVAVLVSGCGTKDDTQTAAQQWNAPPPLTKPERDTGIKACEAFAARVCACAQRSEANGGTFATRANQRSEDCTLANMRPISLREQLAMLDDPTASLGPKGRAFAVTNARKIIARCFEADAALDPDVCARNTSARQTPTRPEPTSDRHPRSHDDDPS